VIEARVWFSAWIFTLLGLDGLVQAFGPAAAGHQAAGEFVDDHHFAVLHHVVLILVVQRVGAQGGVEVVDQQDVARIVEAGALGQHAQAAEDLLGVLVALLGEQHRVGLEVDGVVARLGDVLALAFLAGQQAARRSCAGRARCDPRPGRR
jgi:hypothetical protein